MTNIHEILEAMSGAAADARSQYHLTLGRLIKCLEKIPKGKPIFTQAGLGVEGFCSYRGYYSDLALNPASGPEWTAGQLLQACKAVINTTLTGYKGGDFLMTKNTPVWLASYGCLGPAIMDLTPEGLVITRDLDEQED
jgi:hypothetical protein